MKKLVFALAMIAFGQTAFSQTTKTATEATAQSGYEKVMMEKISKINAAHTTEELTALGNDFARIAAKETAKWEPNYYAAFALVQNGRMAMQTGKTDTLDALADQAQKYLDAAKALSKDNAELFILEKMIHSLRMMVSPMTRFMSESPLAAEALAQGEKLDPSNPRITLLKAEDTYFTPAAFGGSKEKGLELFRQSLEQFKTYKTSGALSPSWGRSEAEYFLSQAK